MNDKTTNAIAAVVAVFLLLVGLGLLGVIGWGIVETVLWITSK